MACQPSSTFLLVASSTSNAGTICPAGMASILIPPCVSLSTFSPNILKCSCSVLLAGQVDCILIDFGAGACACAPKLTAAASAATMYLLIAFPLKWIPPRLTAISLPIIRYSEALCPWPQLELPRPRTAMLTVDREVALRDLVGQQHAVVAPLPGPRVVASLDAAVDDEMRDVDVLRRELARHALRQAAQGELPHRERRRLGVALDAGRGTGEEDGAGAARQHALGCGLCDEEAGEGRDVERLLHLLRLEV